jgi:signal transduction histidine kinase/DNA-binding NarL/FixJ family response regulator
MAIIVIVLFTTTAQLGISLFFTRSRIIETVRSDIQAIVDIADEFISARIALLKSDAEVVARTLEGVPDHRLKPVLDELLGRYQDFLAFTVFRRDHLVVSSGTPPTPEDRLRDSEYLQEAFKGATIISTTRQDPSGTLVLHVCTLIDEGRVLSVTVPGMLFSELIADFRIWETGNIFMLDETGVPIANVRPSMVLERVNYPERGKVNPNERSMGEFVERMLSSSRGVGVYKYLDGAERFCAWKTLRTSRKGWVVGIAAPLMESPAAQSQEGLLIAAGMFLGLCAALAVLVSHWVSRPFYRLQEQNQSLASLNAEVKAANEAKSNFLASMSHEMRTPMSAVIGLSELLLSEESVEGEVRENLEKIYHSGETLLAIINDILDISKIESGNFQLSPVEYETSSFINDTITLNIMRIAEKSITFKLDVDDNLPSRLFGDDLRVKQMCNNLLSNAFKYTQEGTVEWRIACERKGDVIWMTNQVKDTGIGIKPEDLPKLFSNYSQVDMSSHRKIEGTGLGLALVKRMAEMMGGSVTVESEYGKGSVFTVRFRQGFVTDVPLGLEVAESLRSFHYLKNKRERQVKFVRVPMPYAKVLVVDDVPTNLDVARGMMKPYKMRVDCALSGSQAINLVRGGDVQYDVIFMDHMMPEMDGVETLRRIRELGTDYAKNVPIIILTANAIVGNEEAFLQEGFQAFLSKPINAMFLDSLLRRWVRNKNREKECEDKERKDLEGVTNPPATLQSESLSGSLLLEAWKELFGAPDVGLIDLERGIERFGRDEVIYLEVLESYARDTPLLLEGLRCVEPETLAAYAVTVHGIKGSSRGICAGDVGALAEDLERAAKAEDLSFIEAKNSAFLAAAEQLAERLSALIQKVRKVSAPKPLKPEPDLTTLAALRAACEKFDIDEADKAMNNLTAWEYESGGELITWLKEQAALLNFKQIAERLSRHNGANTPGNPII